MSALLHPPGHGALLDAVINFEDQLLEFESVLESYDQVARDNTPPWLFVMMMQSGRLSKAFELISKHSRGIGVVDPDIAKRGGIKGGRTAKQVSRSESVHDAIEAPAQPKAASRRPKKRSGGAL